MMTRQKPVAVEVLENQRKVFGRSGQIENPIASCPPVAVHGRQPFLQSDIGLRILESSRYEIERGCNGVPSTGVDRLATRELLCRFTQARPELVDCHSSAAESNDREWTRQCPVCHQVVECGQKLPAAEIPERAENHERARLRPGGFQNRRARDLLDRNRWRGSGITHVQGAVEPEVKSGSTGTPPVSFAAAARSTNHMSTPEAGSII
jgi:hypothetical protein